MKTAEFINDNCPQGKIYYTISGDTPDYDHSLEYAFKQFGREIPNIKILKKNIPYDAGGCYYFISQYATDLPKRLTGFVPDKTTDLGNIVVLRFHFSEEKIVEARLLVSNEDEDDLKNNQEGDQEQDSMDEVDLGGHSRLFWKDVVPGFRKRF